MSLPLSSADFFLSFFFFLTRGEHLLRPRDCHLTLHCSPLCSSTHATACPRPSDSFSPPTPPPPVRFSFAVFHLSTVACWVPPPPPPRVRAPFFWRASSVCFEPPLPVSLSSVHRFYPVAIAPCVSPRRLPLLSLVVTFPRSHHTHVHLQLQHDENSNSRCRSRLTSSSPSIAPPLRILGWHACVG